MIGFSDSYEQIGINTAEQRSALSRDQYSLYGKKSGNTAMWYNLESHDGQLNVREQVYLWVAFG